MFTSGIRRILCAITVATLLVAALCVTALAADVVIDVQKAGSTAAAKYDPENPSAGGWTLSASKPESGTLALNWAENSMGFYDSAIRYKNVTEDAVATYILAESEQFSLKNMGSVVYYRRVAGGINFINNYGAKYELILETVDGQTVSVIEDYYNGTPAETISNMTSDIQAQVEALEGDAILKSISFRPYASSGDYFIRDKGTHIYGYEYQVKVQAKDEEGNLLYAEDGKTPIYEQATDEEGNLLFEEDGTTPIYVYETKTSVGTHLYYLFKTFTFKEATPIPKLASVKDTYNGTTVTEHNGKITGLDPNLTYAYGPIYAKTLTTITGVTEIDGLTGGVYEITATESGKSASTKAYVTVHKERYVADEINIVSASTDWRIIDDGESGVDDSGTAIKSNVPYNGYWTSPVFNPYNSGATNLALTGSSTPAKLRGEFDPSVTTGYYMANNETAAEYFRRNCLKFVYVLTPEQQFYPEDRTVSVSMQHGGAKEFDCMWKYIFYAVAVYTDGAESEPYIVPLNYTGSGSQTGYSFVIKGLPEDALVTRMEFFNYWDVPSIEDAAIISTVTTYPRIASFSVKNVARPEAPVYELVGGEKDGEFKAIGLDPYLKHETSADGVVWTQIGNEVTGLKAGDTVYLRAVGINGALSETVTVSVPADAVAQPVTKAVAADGAITGLDTALAYEYTTFNIFGFGEWTAVEAGASSITVDTGLYAVRVKASETALAGAECFVLVGDTAMTPVFKTETGAYSANTTVTDGTKVGPFELGIWSSDRVYKVLKDGSHNTSRAQLMVNGDNYPFATGDAYVFAQTYNFNFANTPDQTVPVNELGTFQVTFSGGGHMGINLWEGKTTADYIATIRIYVADSDVSYYEIPFKWGVKFNIAELLPAGARGYVTAISVRPWGGTPEGWQVQDGFRDNGTTWDNTTTTNTIGRTNYGYANISNWTLLTPAEAPVIDVGANSEGGYTLSGFDVSLSYAISSDKSEWTEFTGVTAYDVDSIGTYYVRQLSTSTASMSDIVELEIKGAQPTVEGLEAADGKITGLDATKTYEYAYYNINGFSEWTTVTGVTEIEVEPALWYVRHPSGDGYVAGEAQIVHVIGGNYGSISYAVTNAAGTYVPGSITSTGSSSPGSASFGGFTTWRVAGSWTPNYENRQNFTFTYSMANDEIIPAQDLAPIRYTIGNGVRWPFEGAAQGKVRFHIADGKADYYDILYMVDADSNYNFTADINDVLPEDENGYVVGFSIWYAWEVPSKTVANAAWGAPVLSFLDIYEVAGWTTTDTANAWKAQDRWRVSVLENEELQALETEIIDNAYITAKKVILDPAKSYQYAYQTSNYVNVAAGTTELVIPANSTMLLRYAPTETEPASAPVSLSSEWLNPIFTARARTLFNSVSDSLSGLDRAYEGWWNNYNEGWGTQAEVCSQITSAITLSNVYYKYTFAKDEQFVINDHPYFAADFNNELNNMNIARGFISGAVAEFSIWVDGVDTPYTVTSDWKGYAKASGFTGNKVVVNLLDTYPELDGKTVTAMMMRPYSNIDLTPNDYNTEATANRYIYFRLYFMGFFDAADNTASVNTNQRVTTVSGIQASTETEYAVGDSFDVSTLVVEEVYANGGTWALNNYSYTVPADFATEAGTYAVEVEWNGMMTTLNVEVKSPVVLESIAVSGGKTEYFVGETYTNDGVKVEAVYSDGTVVDVTAEAVIGTADTAEAGTKTVTVTYAGQTASFDVTVKAVEVVSIEIETEPANKEYFVGQTLNTDGLKVVATYNNGTTAEITEYAVDTTVLDVAGTKTVTVTYAGQTASFDVTVKAVELTSIEFTAPNKTVYNLNEELDLDGMLVKAIYSDGTSADVTAKATVNADLTTAGTKTVTVTYEGHSASFEIEVVANSVAGDVIGDIAWQLYEGGTLVISGDGKITDYSRTRTAPWYAYADSITAIVIEDGVKAIGSYAFYNLTNAETITVAESVMRVGTQFIRGTAIKEVALPGVEIIRNAAFSASAVETVILSENVTDIQGNMFHSETVKVKAPENSYAAKYAELYGDLYSTGATVTLETDGAAEKPVVRFGSAGDNVFYAIYELATENWKYEISGLGRMKNFPYISAKNIAKGYTFTPTYYLSAEEQKNVKSISVLTGVTTIGNHTFYKATKAKNIELHDGITYIGSNAFWVCAKLTEISIPESVVEIGSNVFNGCASLTTVYIPEGVETVGDNIFVKCNVANITVYTESPAAVVKLTEQYPELNLVTSYVDPDEIYTAEQLSTAVALGRTVRLANDIELSADTAIVIENGKTAEIDLNGNTLTVTSTLANGSLEAFLVKGALTVKNGNVTYEHKGDNMGTASAATVFDVTAGGVLNLENVTVENLGGTDISLVVNMENSGDVTLNATEATLKSTYCAIRVLNADKGMNSVTLNACTLHADDCAFLVCNYVGDLDPAEHPDEAIVSRLDLDIFNGTNTITAGEDGTKENVARYGASDTVYYDANGNEYFFGDVWDGTADTSWYDENATEHVLYNAEQLAGFAQLVEGGNTFEGETVKLVASLDLDGRSWTPIGAGAEFKGTFDGYNRTVENFALSVYNTEEGIGAGLFGALGEGATVKNLTVADVVSDGKHDAVGVIAGYAMGNVAFENVHVAGAGITAVSKVGGLVGVSYGSLTVSGCSVTESTFTGTYNLGGIAGLVKGENTVTLTETVTDVEFVLEDKYSNGFFGNLGDGNQVWIYIDADGVWYYAACADMYCYESTETARAEYIDSLGLTFSADHLDALICNK